MLYYSDPLFFRTVVRYEYMHIDMTNIFPNLFANIISVVEDLDENLIFSKNESLDIINPKKALVYGDCNFNCCNGCHYIPTLIRSPSNNSLARATDNV